MSKLHLANDGQPQEVGNWMICALALTVISSKVSSSSTLLLKWKVVVYKG